MKDEILSEEFNVIPQPKSHKKIKIAITLIAFLGIIATTTLLVGHFKFDLFKNEVYIIDPKISRALNQEDYFTEKKAIKSKIGASAAYDYLDYDYSTKKFVKKTCSNPTSIDGDERYLTSGWYVVSRYVMSKYRVEISGKVNIILLDGFKWEAVGGLNVASGSQLTIFGQTGGTGQLESNSDEKYEAAIGGGENQSVGDITINGGKVFAHSYGGSYGAGIGGGSYGKGGKVTINGGFVEAFSSDGAGIGGGVYGTCGTTIINGGEVNAESSQGAGIGGGPNKAGGSVSINGGKVIAQSSYGSGIGAGVGGKDQGTLKIGSGVTLYGGNSESSLKILANKPTENVTTRTKYMKVN